MNLVTQGTVCLHPQTQIAILKGERLQACESFSKVANWPTNGSDFFLQSVLPFQLAGSCWLHSGHCGTWCRVGSCLQALVKCCQVEWSVFLSSESLLIYFLQDTVVSQQQLWVFIYSCVLRTLCHCQSLYGLLKFQSLCFYGHCLLKRSAIWGNDRFAF